MRLELKQYDGVRAFREGTWQVEFILSRRNLLTLLRVLDARGSALRIESNEAYLGEGHIANTTVVVRCESDEEHYSHPLRGSPGAGADGRRLGGVHRRALRAGSARVRVAVALVRRSEKLRSAILPGCSRQIEKGYRPPHDANNYR